jgi:hypothetical protein
MKKIELKEDLAVVINEENLEEHTGFDKTAWMRLTGLFEDAGFADLVKPEDIIVNKRKSEYPFFSIDCDPLTLQIVIDIEKKEIENVQVLFDGRGKGLGLIAHANQVCRAGHMGFNRMFLRAFVGRVKDGLFNGHVTWAKFGYTMTATEQVKFEEKIQELGRQEECIHELVHDKLKEKEWGDADGFGYDWDGEFFLAKKSCNRNWLAFYRYKKNKAARHARKGA